MKANISFFMKSYNKKDEVGTEILLNQEKILRF